MKEQIILFSVLLVTANSMSAVADDLDKWSNDLDDPNPSIRAIAAEELGESKDPKVVTILIAAMNDSDRDVRISASSALTKIGEPAVEPLITLLKEGAQGNDSSFTMDLAIIALGDIGDIRAADLLIDICNSTEDSPYGYSLAAGALAKLGKSEYFDGLIERLDYKNWEFREQAAAALGYVNDSRAVGPLIVALNDDHPYVRSNAAHSLGMLSDTRAVDSLIQRLKDEEPWVRKQAAWALGELNDVRAVNPLVQALEGQDSEVYAQILNSLKKMGCFTIGDTLYCDQELLYGTPGEDIGMGLKTSKAYPVGLVIGNSTRDEN